MGHLIFAYPISNILCGNQPQSFGFDSETLDRAILLVVSLATMDVRYLINIF